MKKRIGIALIPLMFLLVLGGLNIQKKITWKVPSDGVRWEKKVESLIALHVDRDSPGYLAGIEKGDILLGLKIGEFNPFIPVTEKTEVSKILWEAWKTNQKVIYQISREEESLFPSLYLKALGVKIIYFFLVFIGLTAIVISGVVFLFSKRPFTTANVFFYILSLLFYSFCVFSPTGELDILDSLFFWLDKVSFLTFPALFLNFYLVFPVRKRIIKKKPTLLYTLYIPALVQLAVLIFLHMPFIQKQGTLIFSMFSSLEKIGLLHFALLLIMAQVSSLQTFLRPPTLLIKRQLKWTVLGQALGILPFSLFYIVPFILGHIPSRASEFMLLFLAFIPLTLAHSISRYKHMDFEILLKKAVTLISSYVVITIVYSLVSLQTKVVSENELTMLLLGILAIILGATLFSPLKKIFQALLDRIFYKRSYQYRRTLLSISKELSRERNLQNLSKSLLELIDNALSLKGIALLLPKADRENVFTILRSRGELTTKKTSITINPDLLKHLTEVDYLFPYSFPDKKDMQRKFEKLTFMGIYHLLALKVEDNLIGCLAMGKKKDNTFLSSDDSILLTTISSPVALALENAYLYNQVHLRAQELERLKDYSENIIENLTVGIAVLDQRGKITAWNRVLEETFFLKKDEVLNKGLIEVIGEKNFTAIFPSDTQQDYRLLSEIPLDLPFGGKKIFDIAKTPLLDNTMTPFGTIVVFEDITEKFSLQQQLLTSEKLASIGLLSAGVAHEINTPLTGISSYVQILQKKIEDSQHYRILEKIETQTERVARIVKNLLNFARNPSDSYFHQIDLKNSLNEIVSLIDYKLKNMNIKLQLNLEPIEAIWAQGERLQQVFINIILNAIDAMPGGGTLTIELTQSENNAVILIKDTGTGIKPQHLSHIFDPFFTTKGLGKGTGLGLSISYAVIKEHEGHVVVDSEVGKGTQFAIYIPMNLGKKETAQKSNVSKSEGG
ncbi:MAG: GAF domain-containing protein [Candidatus Aminicenantes bacterium]|nr:GAF domain-containing protein [Candidatus Aminicenantes bacterium]